MTDARLRAAAAALALVGAALATYLLYVRHGGGAPICSNHGCETVQASRYATLFGIPVAAFGLAGYAALFGTAVARGELARAAHGVMALTAFAFSSYLLYLQLHTIGAVCEWCVASDVITTGLAVLALLRVRVEARAAYQPG